MWSMNDTARAWISRAGSTLYLVGGTLGVTTRLLQITSDAVLPYATLAFWSGLLIHTVASQPSSRFERAWRNVRYVIFAILGMAIIAEVFSIESPFSDRQNVWIILIAVLAAFVIVPAYLLYSGWPAMRDYFALQHRPKQPTAPAGQSTLTDNGTIEL